jgi:putative FmdB family regulatory protein
MPLYQLKCPKCGAETEKICIVSERNNQPCDKCGEAMKVQITTMNYVFRNIKLRHQKWIKERGL